MITAITGATGHIGANLVRALIADGRRVRCMVRKDRASAPFSTAIGRVRGREPLFAGESLDALAMGTRVDCTKAREELGFSACDLRRTLRDAYAWFVETGRIRLVRPLDAGAGAAGSRERA